MANRWKHCVCFDRPDDLNLRPPVPETNALPLDQLAGDIQLKILEINDLRIKA